MKFIRLACTQNGKFQYHSFINPEEITRIERRLMLETYVELKNGQAIRVKESPTQIIDRIND